MKIKFKQIKKIIRDYFRGFGSDDLGSTPNPELDLFLGTGQTFETDLDPRPYFVGLNPNPNSGGFWVIFGPGS